MRSKNKKRRRWGEWVEGGGGGGEKCIQGFGEGTRGKRHFGRPSSSWKHDIKLYLRGAMEWIDLAQNRDK